MGFLRQAAFLLFVLLMSPLHGQWGPSGIPGNVMILRQVVASPSGDTIYAGGVIQIGTDPWYEHNPVCMYTGGAWTTYGDLDDDVFSMVVYHDTLIAAGYFEHIDDTLAAAGCVYHTSSGWHPYGSFADGGIRKLRVLNDTLYAVGSFREVDGQPATGVARRDGGHWVSVGTCDCELSVLTDIALYRDTLVVTGGFDFSLPGRDIAYLSRGEDAWHLLGPGILGGMSGATCLAVYQDELYLGGQIALSDGNPGQDIMRWNGHEFRAVGNGVQHHLNVYTGFSTVSDMVVHNDLLFVCGGFSYASGVPARGVAVWDGTHWCAPQGSIPDLTASGGISLDFYGDTLFVACHDTADGQFVNGLTKFIGDNYLYTCSPVGIAEAAQRDLPPPMPNPASGTVRVQLPAGRYSLRVFDSTGRLEVERSITSGGSCTYELDVSRWAEGTYTVKLPGLSWRLVVIH